jgi:hypothetical protein
VSEGGAGVETKAEVRLSLESLGRSVKKGAKGPEAEEEDEDEEREESPFGYEEEGESEGVGGTLPPPTGTSEEDGLETSGISTEETLEDGGGLGFNPKTTQALYYVDSAGDFINELRSDTEFLIPSASSSSVSLPCDPSDCAQSWAEEEDSEEEEERTVRERFPQLFTPVEKWLTPEQEEAEAVKLLHSIP